MNTVESKLKTLEAVTNKLLDKDDGWMIRKYTNRQNFEVVDKIAKRNPKAAKGIYELYNFWGDVLSMRISN